MVHGTYIPDRRSSQASRRDFEHLRNAPTSNVRPLACHTHGNGECLAQLGKCSLCTVNSCAATRHTCHLICGSLSASSLHTSPVLMHLLIHRTFAPEGLARNAANGCVEIETSTEDTSASRFLPSAMLVPAGRSGEQGRHRRDCSLRTAARARRRPTRGARRHATGLCCGLAGFYICQCVGNL